MTHELTINYENPALVQFRLKKGSFSFFKVSSGKAVKDSQGDIVPNNRGLRTNSKLIPDGHFMQVETRTS